MAQGRGASASRPIQRKLGRRNRPRSRHRPPPSGFLTRPPDKGGTGKCRISKKIWLPPTIASSASALRKTLPKTSGNTSCSRRRIIWNSAMHPRGGSRTLGVSMSIQAQDRRVHGAEERWRKFKRSSGGKVGTVFRREGYSTERLPVTRPPARQSFLSSPPSPRGRAFS